MNKILFLIPFYFSLSSLTSCGRGPHMPLTEQNTTQTTIGKGNSNSTGAITFADVRPIFQKCTACHGIGKANPSDWLDYKTASSKTIQLMDRVVIKGDMPLGSKLEPQEIKILATWIKTGALPEAEEQLTEPEIPVDQPTTSPVAEPPPIQQEPILETPTASPWPANLVSIKNIFDKNCFMCHAGTIPGAPDWQDFTTVESKKDRIYDRTVVKKDMPLGIEIPDSDRDKIKNWLDGKPIEITPWPLQFQDVALVFETNCKLCHNADSGLPNWNDYAVVESKLTQLRDRLLVKKDMPMGNPLSMTDLEKIKNWLDEVSP